MMHANAIVHSQCVTLYLCISVECLCLRHDLSQLSEDVKASCVSYGHTSTMHSRGLLHKPGYRQ